VPFVHSGIPRPPTCLAHISQGEAVAAYITKRHAENTMRFRLALLIDLTPERAAKTKESPMRQKQKGLTFSCKFKRSLPFYNCSSDCSW